MTTKTFCDGCDREIEIDYQVRRLAVHWVQLSGDAVRPDIPIELCDRCEAVFRNDHLPKRWARIVPK